MKADATSTPASGAPMRGQTTSVTVYAINLKITDGSNPSSCNFNVTGSVSGATLTNGNPSTLAIPAKTNATSNLVISNFTLTNGASQCFAGAFTGNGDRISYSATYNLNPTTSTQGPIWVNAT